MGPAIRSKCRLATKTPLSAQAGKAGIDSRITTSARRILPRHWSALVGPISRRLASTRLIKTSRWSAVSLKIKCRRRRREFHQRKIRRASRSCSQREVPCAPRATSTEPTRKPSPTWATCKRVLVAQLTSNRRTRRT